MDTNAYINYAFDTIKLYGPNILISLAILAIGLWVIRRIIKAFQVFLIARQVDESLRPFFVALTDIAMKITLILVVAGRLGLETTSFIAVFSAGIFAIGLALQGSLGNFASGILLLMFRHVKTGDWVVLDGKMGFVHEIQIFNTILVTPQGKYIIIPNRKMTEGILENMTMEGEVRADAIIHVKDNTSIPTLRDAAEAAIKHCPYRSQNKPAVVEIQGFPKDSIEVVIGCWTTGQHYWETFYFLHERVKYEFDIVGIKLAKEDEW
jgi:small conductance mechanosensitive channel